MTKKEILEIFEKTGAILNGHFLLSSGLHSPQYLQCAKVLQYPEYAEKLCKALVEKFSPKPNVVIAPALGGIIVSYEAARNLGAKSLFTERIDGKMVLRRGLTLDKKDNVLVVEDVITTGLSTREVIEVVKKHSANLIGVGCLVNRAKEKLQFGVEMKFLLEMDIPTFDSKKCPNCKNGMPLAKPGSRIA